jgi:glycosyltransferase involved in cell wall biosynthesis
MRVLIISFAFPPCSLIGSIRVGKTAKYLRRFGHDVRVVSSNFSLTGNSVAVEIPTQHVTYTNWIDVDAPYQRMLTAVQTVRRRLNPESVSQQPQWLESAQQRLHGTSEARSSSRRLTERIRIAYQDVVHVPDENIGWYLPALREARRIANEFRPDVIFASAKPTTGLLVARRLSDETGIPWVGELRDLWADNHYNDTSRVRKSLDQWLERRTLRNASALVTVSEPLAESLRVKYDVPVSVVLNGYDTEDSTLARQPSRMADGDLELLHTGNVLAYRDPSPLFEALRLLGPLRSKIQVVFRGPLDIGMRSHLRALAARHGVEELVKFAENVSHAESVGLQQRADVLLLLTWNNLLERGVYTGKLFEYIGARRPILSVGLSEGVAAALINERNLGFASADPHAIAAQLSKWLEEKRVSGCVGEPNAKDVRDLTREEQTRKLERLLQEIVNGNLSVTGQT